MKSKVIATNQRGAFVGTEADGSFCVFTLGDFGDIELGDILRGVFDDSNGLSKEVFNETQGQSVHIWAEHWSCSRAAAFKALENYQR